MKRSILFLALGCLGALAGCPATMQPGVSPAQRAVNLTASACRDLDSAIVATDQSVLAGVLKGNAARDALKGLTAAQAGCVVALGSIQSATAAANPAGVSK